ncbi:arylesterase [Chitinimonas sp.]|uniref:arylesterase n=1 Tax=Chitinimonas sp. TaxID=1934313 RepID=UPI0035B4B812
MSRFMMVLGCLLMMVAAMAAESKTILVFGDSLSAGYGLKYGEAWPNLLQQRLGRGWQVVNASVSGETTAGGLTRLPAALAEHKPAIVVLELGANDGLRGLPINAARQNLASMIEKNRAAGAKTVLISMQLPPNFGAAYTSKFAAMFDELAQQYQLPKPPFLFEGIADRPELFQADQLHPVASAQARLLDTVWQALGPLTQRR